MAMLLSERNGRDKTQVHGRIAGYAASRTAEAPKRDDVGEAG